MKTMKELHEYLKEVKPDLVKDDWLDSYLRPQFKKGFIHTVNILI